MRKTLIIWTLLLVGCSDSNDIPFEVNESMVVVEGWLTNLSELQYVRVSRTVPFTTSKKNESISGAQVSVEERLNGNVVREIGYTYQENGYYYSDQPIQGVPGNTYQLVIELPSGDLVYSTEEKMEMVTPIDTLSYDVFTRESEEDPNVLEDIYFPIAWTSDPVESENFYRWKLYRNGVLFDEPNEIFLFTDRFIEGNASYRQEFPFYEYRFGDTIRTDRIAISKRAYNFLSQLKSQTTSLGTNTAVAPAAVIGNLTNQTTGEPTLGFFGAAAITSKEVVIPE